MRLFLYDRIFPIYFEATKLSERELIEDSQWQNVPFEKPWVVRGWRYDPFNQFHAEMANVWVPKYLPPLAAEFDRRDGMTRDESIAHLSMVEKTLAARVRRKPEFSK